MSALPEKSTSYKSLLLTKDKREDRKSIDLLLARLYEKNVSSTGCNDFEPKETSRRRNKDRSCESEQQTKNIKVSNIPKTELAESCGRDSKFKASSKRSTVNRKNVPGSSGSEVSSGKRRAKLAETLKSKKKVKTTLMDNGVSVSGEINSFKGLSSLSRDTLKQKKKLEKKGCNDKLKQTKITESFKNSIEATEPKPKEKRTKFKLKFEEMLACRDQLEQEQKKLEELRLNMEEIDKMDLSFNEIDEVVVREDVTFLNCKNLNDEELKESFNKSYSYMSEIHDGTRLSTRRDRFMNGDSMKSSVSTCSFTYAQIKLLYSLLHEKFGHENVMCTNDKYFFQVLIPELCMKIFMEEHNMSFNEAMKYLRCVPVKENS